jgi:hypothetical protein
MEHCFLCGITLPENRQRRYKPSAELQAFVRARCVPTPLAYACIDEAAGLPEESPVCIACINWKRRAGCRGKKQHLQVDQLAMYVMQPGRMAELDQRCVGRLLDALADPTSPFARCLPLPVTEIVSRLEAHDVPSITKAWWDFNARTRFFRHPQTARLVRTLQKQDGPE